MRAIAREHPAGPVLPSHRRARELRAAQLPEVRPALEPRGLAAPSRLPDCARGQVPQRLHAVRAQRDPTRLGRLAGDGLHPDGEVLRLHAERERQAGALRRLERGLLDDGADAEGDELHPAAEDEQAVLSLLRSDRAAPPRDSGATGSGEARGHRTAAHALDR
jgi:hypothetical protein